MKLGAVGRGIGRRIALGAAVSVGLLATPIALTAVTMSPAVITGGSIAASILGNAANVGGTLANVIRSYRDVRDISAAEGAGNVRKKDRV